MDIQNNAIVIDADTEALDSQITQISNDFAETYYLDNEQQEELEMLVAKAMKLGELYERQKWQAKAQVVPEWIDYTKQSPRIDGRYQIFISGEQITADWQSPFGFSDPVEGEALIQGLISHWGMLPEPPKAQEQGQ